MTGMSNISGRTLSRPAQKSQSIIDRLTTPLGSRVIRRGYGSDLFKRIGDPLNAATVADIVADAARALDDPELRFEVTAIRVDEATPSGFSTFSVEGNDLDSGEFIEIREIAP
jgi:phage baseplate assembly protein W